MIEPRVVSLEEADELRRAMIPLPPLFTDLVHTIATEPSRVRAAVDASLRMEPGRWWRVVRPDGQIWCETSNEQEARSAMNPGDNLQRWFTSTSTEWRNA